MAVAMAFAASGLFGDASSGLRCAQRVKCSEGGGEGELGGSLEGAWGPRQAGPGLAPLPSQWARPTTLSPVARPPHFWPQPQRTIEGTILTSPLRASSETVWSALLARRRQLLRRRSRRRRPCRARQNVGVAHAAQQTGGIAIGQALLGSFPRPCTATCTCSWCLCLCDRLSTWPCTDTASRTRPHQALLAHK